MRPRLLFRAEMLFLGVLLSLLVPFGLTAKQAGAATQPVAGEAAEHFNRGDQLLRQQRVYPAILEFRTAVQLNPDHVPSHGGLMVAYLLSQHFALSWKEIRIIRQSHGEPPERLLETLTREMSEAEAAEQLAQIEKDLGEAQQAANARPESAATRARLALAFEKSGALAEAMHEAEEALRLEAAQPDAHLVVAKLYFQDPKTREDAISHFRAFLRKAPQTPSQAKAIGEAWFLLGTIFLDSGRQGQAVEAYEEGLKAAPTDVHLLNNVAWVYATAQDAKLRNPQRALQYAQKAVELSEGKNASYLDTLAEAHYLNGQLDYAIQNEKKAITIRPGDDFLRNQLKKFEEAKRNQSDRP